MKFNDIKITKWRNPETGQNEFSAECGRWVFDGRFKTEKQALDFALATMRKVAESLRVK